MKRFLLALSLIITSVVLSAQTVVLPYEFGFEESDSLELRNWVLNPGSDSANDSIDKWCVGGALRSNGQRGLYISNDAGQTSNCGATDSNGRNQKIVQFAYRDLELPDGIYYVTFDWICPNQKLYVGYVQYTDSLSRQAQNITQQLGSEKMPNVGTPRIATSPGIDVWNNDLFTLTVQNPAGHRRWYRLYFAWANSEKDVVQHGISCGIDNVQIIRAGCRAPWDFRGFVDDCDHVKFDWKGGSPEYQIQYRPVGATSWYTRKVRGDVSTYTFQGMSEGAYDFRVRGMCFEDDTVTGKTDTIYSPYVYCSNFSVFCPELHCINYANLTDTVLVHCTYGTTNSQGYYQTAQLAYANKGVIDKGWESIESRHTVCWDTTAMDPRTGNRLRMVPHGAVASVRLGNWDDGYGAEAITYDYFVDESNSIILVNYAIVLEDPSGHGDDAMPRFVVQIFDEQDSLIDATCGKVDLNPLNEADWVKIRPQGSSENLVFKDWTTLGLNLDPYIGQHIKISVATYDCFWSAHYGYAYFTIECESARIKNTSCGTDQSLEVHAPTGFLYEWTAKGTSVVRSDQPTITILPTDPSDWICRLTSTENPDCSFELEVNTTPRYPQAEFALTYSPLNCENRYEVSNTSYIVTYEDLQRVEHRDEVCREFEWDFGIGEEGKTSEANPGYIVFPDEGGTFQVKLSAMIGGGEGNCRSDSVFTLFVPEIGPTNRFDTVVMCDGAEPPYYEWNGERRFLLEPGEADFLVQAQDPLTGCMHNDRLHLVLLPQSPVTILPDTTVCYGESVTIGDKSRATTGSLSVKFMNQYGCDSLVVRNVNVLPEIIADLDWQDIDDDHEFATIYVTMPGDTTCTYFMFEGQKYTSSAALGNLKGGDYDLVFYNDYGCAVPQTVSLKSGCLRNMIFQRWNDILSLKNAETRDSRYSDLVFTAYQWYCDGVAIAGATKSYYYQAGGLTAGARYTCLVTMEDGTQEETCGFVPVLSSSAAAPTVTPTLVHDGEMITVYVPEKAELVCHSAMGVKIFETGLQEGDNYIQASLSQGVYMLTVQMTDGNRTFRIVAE